MSSFDLIFLPLVRHDSQGQDRSPGFWFTSPPRRSARGRSSDHLFLHFGMSGSAEIEIPQQYKMFEKLGETYYKSSGSVTNAMRSVAEQLNKYLLSRNLRLSGQGLQGIGFFTIGVVRSGQLYVGQSGSTHLMKITNEAQHFHDPHLAGRGLGLGRTTALRYLQFELAAGDIFLISSHPSPGWTPSLLPSKANLGMDELRRYLIDQVDVDPRAVLCQVQQGKGMLRLERPSPRPAEPEAKPLPVAETDLPDQLQPSTDLPAAAIDSDEQSTGTYSDFWSEPTGLEELVRQEQPVPEGEKHPGTAPTIPDRSLGREMSEGRRVGSHSGIPGHAPAQEGDESVESLMQPVPEEGKKWSPPRLNVNLAPVILALWRAVRNTRQQISQAFRGVLERILPDDALLNLPSSVMAFIAVAVPLIVVAIASTVYFQQGKVSYYDQYYAEAARIYQKTQDQTDLNELRTMWRESLTALDRAEAYQVTEQSKTLRSMIQSSLDKVDAIDRLDFQPAIVGGLPESIKISKIAIYDEDIYLLNATSGDVLRATLSAQGYRVDPDFVCGPTPNSGPLVDIVTLPPGNEPDATVVGVDANGTLLYCRPNQAPLSSALPTPDSNWGAPQAISLSGGSLYLLDPLTNAVWIFESELGDGVFDVRPRFFFANQVPNLRNAVDFAIYRDDLYVLHADNHLTTCTYSLLENAPTRCDEFAVFTDLRDGRSSGPEIADAKFSQILYTAPPDPSIYMLDPQQRSIYHFSLRLTLQRQYQARGALPEGEATAFAISPGRVVFLGLGNQLYYANIP